MRIVVFHNIATDEAGRHAAWLDGYRRGHPLVPVHRFPDAWHADPLNPTGDVLDLCERVWRLFNVGHDPEFGQPDVQALTYRENGNRSMSKGDVILVGDEWWACQSRSWEKVDAPRWLAVGASMHGTRSLPKGRADYPLDLSEEGGAGSNHWADCAPGCTTDHPSGRG